MEATSGVDETVLALPKGGGAVQPIGTTFDVDLNTGTGSFTIPLELPTGPNAIRPELSLLYSSGAGDGIFGIGWTLSQSRSFGGARSRARLHWPPCWLWL